MSIYRGYAYTEKGIFGMHQGVIRDVIAHREIYATSSPSMRLLKSRLKYMLELLEAPLFVVSVKYNNIGRWYWCVKDNATGANVAIGSAFTFERCMLEALNARQRTSRLSSV